MYSNVIQIGLGYATDGDLSMAMDYESTTEMIFGLQVGFELGSGFKGEDYSDVINTGEYREDVYELGYSSWSIAGRVGKRVSDKVSVIGALGLTIEQEAENRFDSFHILGNNGDYYVRTGNNSTDIFYGANVKYDLSQSLVGSLGYTSRGVEIAIYLRL